MKIPEIPPNEPYRLQALRALNILDTEREERFDRLTRLTRRIFQVPVSLLSFADENRMWFKSCEGVDFDEIPRDISFCGHAILQDGVFVVADTFKDERFVDNPAVDTKGAMPPIRFYAGCPFRHPDGSRLGTLSIIDHKPRALSAEDVENLSDLASIVERELLAVHLATLDDLTSINNRRGFMNLAEQSLKLCERQGRAATLIFFDLDEFKEINDRFGHNQGDRALQEFAGRLKRSFRDSDICARLSGDEFVVLLPNTRAEEAREVLGRFLLQLKQDNAQSLRGYEVTCSTGIVEFLSGHHRTLEDLLKAGDALMYECKHESLLTR